MCVRVCVCVCLYRPIGLNIFVDTFPNTSYTQKYVYHSISCTYSLYVLQHIRLNNMSKWRNVAFPSARTHTHTYVVQEIFITIWGLSDWSSLKAGPITQYENETWLVKNTLLSVALRNFVGSTYSLHSVKCWKWRLKSNSCQNTKIFRRYRPSYS